MSLLFALKGMDSLSQELRGVRAIVSPTESFRKIDSNTKEFFWYLRQMTVEPGIE